MQIKKAAGSFFPPPRRAVPFKIRIRTRIKQAEADSFSLPRLRFYFSMAMTSISHRTFLGICLTATQLLAGLPVKYSA